MSVKMQTRHATSICAGHASGKKTACDVSTVKKKTNSFSQQKNARGMETKVFTAHCAKSTSSITRKATFSASKQKLAVISTVARTATMLAQAKARRKTTKTKRLNLHRRKKVKRQLSHKKKRRETPKSEKGSP
jgi:hypothetical protein